MNYSYWEEKTWFSGIDYCVIGSGITGLNCALRLKRQYPRAKVLILERGMLPNGASTKNAGFACFGSLSEILEDLKTHTEEEVVQLVKKRIKGLQLLRENLGDTRIGYKEYGGYELFLPGDSKVFEECMLKMSNINKLLKSIFGEDVFTLEKDVFNFRNVRRELIFNKFEGQLNTGKMMEALLHKTHSSGIKILNNITVKGFSEEADSVKINTDQIDFSAGKLFIATNGFAAKMGIADVKPARGQVLISKPISNLELRGTFHLDKGYYYFRNVHNRVLLGGGRNLDFKAEETTELDQTQLIQERLEELLEKIILPGTVVEVDRRWSGIMGIGNHKNPIVKQISDNVFCGVRLGGMGVAIGSLVGKELAELVS